MPDSLRQRRTVVEEKAEGGQIANQRIVDAGLMKMVATGGFEPPT